MSCQSFANFSTQPPKKLTFMASPWPFSQWGIDLIGLLPKGQGKAKYAAVAINYFTKWVEVEALNRITEKKRLILYGGTWCADMGSLMS